MEEFDGTVRCDACGCAFPLDFETRVVGEIETTIVEQRGLLNILQPVAGVQPDILVRQFPAHPLEEGEQRFLVFRLHGFPAENRKTLNPGRTQGFHDLLFGISGERLSEIKIPGLRLEAARTVVPAPGNKEGHPDTQAVGDVRFVDSAVVHGPRTPFTGGGRDRRSRTYGPGCTH